MSKDKKLTTSEPLKRKKKVDPNETPEQKFKRLAEARTKKAIFAIRQIVKLQTTAYKHDLRVERFKKIREILSEEIARIPTSESKKKEDLSVTL